MKPTLTTLVIGLLCLVCPAAMGQQGISSVKIVSVKTSSNQKDSLTILVDSASQDPLHLAYDQNSLRFEFIDVNQPAQQAFAYRLVGLDYYWISCSHCSQVQYAHLDGGYYTFQVKSTQPHSVAAQFNFVVEENIWHRWWFVPLLFLYILALASAGIYFFVLYQFRQKHKQQRLIHMARMNSMAELTAGIAHEIQNPLNFVTNFSDVSTELIEELKTGPLQQLPSSEKDYADEIIGDLTQNLQKINQHGQRASGIVKSMMEHSRTRSGERHPTDLNALCDEFLRLAYHNARAADPSLMVELKTEFDPSLGIIRLEPQEMGRVLLNVYTNAFYALQERQHGNEPNFEPQLKVSTYRQGGHIEIRVRDNGMGMADGVKTKAFQPFFTTKPPGEGTGLGLSLAYDIITNGHGGTLRVESEPGEGTEFVIELPRATVASKG